MFGCGQFFAIANARTTEGAKWETPFPIQRITGNSGGIADVAWEGLIALQIGGRKGDSASGTVSLAWSDDGLMLRVRVKDDSVRTAPVAFVNDPAVDAGRVFNHYDAIEIGVGSRVFAFCPLEDGRVAYYHDLLELHTVTYTGARVVRREDGYELAASLSWQDLQIAPAEGRLIPVIFRIHYSDTNGGGGAARTRRIMLPERAEVGAPVSYGAAFLAGRDLPERYAPGLEPLVGVRLETGAYQRRVALQLTASKSFGPVRVDYSGMRDGMRLYRGSVALGSHTTFVELPVGAANGIVRLHLSVGLEGGEFGPVELEYFSPGGSALVEYRGEMTPPADLDAFWDGKLAELAAIPMDARPEKLPESNEDTTLWKVRLTGWRGVPFYVFLAVPKEEGKYPMRMRGVYPRVPATTAKPERGKVILTVSPRGLGPSAEFSPEPRPASQHRSESGKPEDLYMLANILDWVRAIDYALTLPQVDASLVHVGGGSRGGYLALALAAADSRITSVYATVPAYADVELSARTGKFPDTRQLVFGGSEAEQVRQRAVWSYFDAVNLAHRIRARIIVEAGMRDNICPAPGIVDAFNRIPSRQKILLLNPEGGHAGTPAGRQMEPILAGWRPEL